MSELRALTDRYDVSKSWLDYRAAMVCTVLANIWRDPKKKVRPFTPEDFMPGKKKDSRRQAPEQMVAAAKMLNIAFGGKVVEA